MYSVEPFSFASSSFTLNSSISLISFSNVSFFCLSNSKEVELNTDVAIDSLTKYVDCDKEILSEDERDSEVEYKLTLSLKDCDAEIISDSSTEVDRLSALKLATALSDTDVDSLIDVLSDSEIIALSDS